MKDSNSRYTIGTQIADLAGTGNTPEMSRPRLVIRPTRTLWTLTKRTFGDRADPAWLCASESPRGWVMHVQAALSSARDFVLLRALPWLDEATAPLPRVLILLAYSLTFDVDC